MNPEHHHAVFAFLEAFAVLLEVLAFFFVTIELYGEERLKSAQTLFLEKTSNLSVQFHSRYVSADARYSRISGEAIKFTAIASLTVILYYWLLKWINNYVPQNPKVVSFCFTVVFLVAFWFSLLACSYEALLIVRMVWFKSLSLVFSQLVKDVAEERFKGWLLLRGAVLFLMSKILTVYLLWLR